MAPAQDLKDNRWYRAVAKRHVAFPLALVAVALAVAIGLSVHFTTSSNGTKSSKSISAFDTNGTSSSLSAPNAPTKSTPSGPAIRSKAPSGTSPSVVTPGTSPLIAQSTLQPTTSTPHQPPSSPPTLLPATSSPTEPPATSSPTEPEATAAPTGTFSGFDATKNAAVTLEEGTTSSDSIAFYHCSGGGNSISHVVLLHGASFSKDNWKRSGVLDLFCAWENVAVTALDLEVSARHDKLLSLLKGLPNDLSTFKGSKNIPPVVAALVSPSASGFTMVDWLLSDEVAETLPQMIQLWVPVACGSVLSANEDDLTAGMAAAGSDWPILAIHGDEDSSRSSDQLAELANKTSGGGSVTVVELPGPHAVYLHSQAAFVETVLDAIESNRLG
jgi:pimeloyl-ACP methyl ester carboxylesterase